MTKRKIHLLMEGEVYTNEKGNTCTEVVFKMKGEYLDFQAALAAEIKRDIRLKSLFTHALQHAEHIKDSDIIVQDITPSV